jgi:hypothetical protein
MLSPECTIEQLNAFLHEHAPESKRLPESEWATHRYVIEDEHGCWRWQGPLNSHGYGSFRGERANVYVTHACGLCTSHGDRVNQHCKRRACVRPSHVYSPRARRMASLAMPNPEKHYLDALVPRALRDLDCEREARDNGMAYWLNDDGEKVYVLE